jgi:guanine deaminase
MPARRKGTPLDKFIRAALTEARKGILRGHGGPFGAVIVQNGRIIARGHNLVVKTNDPTSHAEMTAIRKAARKLGRFDLSDCDIYTTSEPCPMCLGAILWARIPKVHYGASKEDARAIGFDDEAFYKALESPYQTPLIRWECLDADACRKPFAEWVAKSDKTAY